MLQDFPEVAEEPGKKPRPERWREDEIITRNGVRVIALGAEKKIRGRRYEEHRPTLMIFDDLENEEQVASAIQREKLWNWFTKAALKAGSAQTNVIVVGTILHFDSLLARLIEPKKSPGWFGKKFRAILSYASRVDLWQTWAKIYNRHEKYLGKDGPEAARAFFEANESSMLEGSEVLWPEKESYYFLIELREREGSLSFESEKQNEPIDPSTQLFKEEEMHFWDDQYGSLVELRKAMGSDGVFIGAVDPSMGRLGRNGDPSAIIALLLNKKTGNKYVTDADIGLKTPDNIIAAIIALDHDLGFSKFGVEVVQYQAFLESELIKRSRQGGRQIPVQSINSVENKKLRIESLQSKIKHGTIQFSRKHRTLLEQLRQFPKGAHDDGPDALQMAVSLANAAPEPLPLPIRTSRPFNLEANPMQDAIDDLTDWLIEDEGYTFRD